MEPTDAPSILVVDDDPAVARLAADILQRAGYQVRVAHSGASALSICDELARPLDLLLTDIVMPGMSGAQLVQEFVTRGCARRYLYMSGFHEGDVRLTHALHHRVPLLPKPFSPSELLDCVRRVLAAAPGENSACCA